MTKYVGRIDNQFDIETLIQAVYRCLGNGTTTVGDTNIGEIEMDLNDNVFIAGTMRFGRFTVYDRDQFVYADYSQETDYITHLQDFENGTEQVMKLQAVANHTDGVIYSSAPVLRDSYGRGTLVFDFGLQYREPKS